MSIQAKQELVSNVEEDIGDFLTVKHTRAVKAVLEEQLGNYEVEAITDDAQVNLDLLDVFIQAKRVEGRSEKTLARYSYIIERVAVAIGKPLDRITTADIREYLSDEKERNIRDRSLEGVRSVLSSFYGWLYEDGLVKSNPIKGIGKIKYRKEVRLPFSAIEMELLKEACTNLRDRAIIMFLYSTGVRVSELCGINRNDLNYETQKCKVLGKGNKERIVCFDEVTSMYLKDYLKGRKDDNPALFVGKRGGRLEPGGVRHMLTVLGEKAGVEDVYPHRFRRTFATDTINNGMPIQTMARLMGHESIQTTTTYAHITDDDIDAQYRRYFSK